MPKPSEWDYYLLICTDVELQGQLTICRNSDFRVEEDPRHGGVAVYDRKTVLLRAESGPLGWLVWLHRKYYRHPFHPGAETPPGVP